MLQMHTTGETNSGRSMAPAGRALFCRAPKHRALVHPNGCVGLVKMSTLQVRLLRMLDGAGAAFFFAGTDGDSSRRAVMLGTAPSLVQRVRFHKQLGIAGKSKRSRGGGKGWHGQGRAEEEEC